MNLYKSFQYALIPFTLLLYNCLFSGSTLSRRILRQNDDHHSHKIPGLASQKSSLMMSQWRISILDRRCCCLRFCLLLSFLLRVVEGSASLAAGASVVLTTESPTADTVASRVSRVLSGMFSDLGPALKSYSSSRIYEIRNWISAYQHHLQEPRCAPLHGWEHCPFGT